MDALGFLKKKVETYKFGDPFGLNRLPFVMYAEVAKTMEEYAEQVNKLKSNVVVSSEKEKSFNHHELDIPFVQSEGGIKQDNEHEGD